MKIVQLTCFYPAYIKQFYSRYPELITASFVEQSQAIFYDSFAWSDFWIQAFSQLGYEGLQIVANCEPLQLAWGRENVSHIPSCLESIAIEQLKQFQPDILWYDHYDLPLLKEIKQAIPSLKLVLGWTGSAIFNLEIGQEIDLMLSCALESVERFREKGGKAEQIHHGFFPDINQRLKSTEKLQDMAFIGQILRLSEFHFQRDQLLENLVKSLDLQIYSPSFDFSLLDGIKHYLKVSINQVNRGLMGVGIPKKLLSNIPVLNKGLSPHLQWKLPVNPRLKKYLHPAVFGLEMYEVIKQSRITLNIHADSSPRYASNMRLFETTGVGTCLLTDWKENIEDLFEVDRQVITYKTIPECLEKVNWLLTHPEEREIIAKAGQKRTLKDHTFEQRTQQLDHLIKTLLHKDSPRK